MKLLVLENSEASTFDLFSQSAFSPERARFGQSGESDATEKEIV
jgi:hypothetical protein